MGYGPLVPDPKGLLSLPEGFSYKIVAQSGVTRLESGEPTPSDPDGTAAFVRHGGNGSVLVNNHEVGGSEPYPVPRVPGFTYDPAAGGGTTNIEVDKDGNRVREYVSLAGTHNNCAGGKSPWNTWLTCEEAESLAGQTKPHGYVFEVDPYDQDANRDPKPIKALGRYAHEALVVDPDSGTIYLTEDAGNPNGLLYRWTPPRRALPLGKGVLESLAGRRRHARGAARPPRWPARTSPTSRSRPTPGTTYRIDWITVPDRDAKTVSTRKQFTDAQITRSRKLEGMWWGDGGAYFVCSFARFTDGSAAQHDGQIWFLDPLAPRSSSSCTSPTRRWTRTAIPTAPTTSPSRLRRRDHRRGRRRQEPPRRRHRDRRRVQQYVPTTSFVVLLAPRLPPPRPTMELARRRRLQAAAVEVDIPAKTS